MVKGKRKRRESIDNGHADAIKIVEDVGEESKPRGRKPKIDRGEQFGALLAGAVNGIVTPLDGWLGNHPAGCSGEELQALAYTGRVYFENSDAEALESKLGGLAGAMLAVSIAAVFLPRAIQSWRKLRKSKPDESVVYSEQVDFESGG